MSGNNPKVLVIGNPPRDFLSERGYDTDIVIVNPEELDGVTKHAHMLELAKRVNEAVPISLDALLKIELPPITAKDLGRRPSKRQSAKNRRRGARHY